MKDDKPFNPFIDLTDIDDEMAKAFNEVGNNMPPGTYNAALANAVVACPRLVSRLPAGAIERNCAVCGHKILLRPFNKNAKMLVCNVCAEDELQKRGFRVTREI